MAKAKLIYLEYILNYFILNLTFSLYYGYFVSKEIKILRQMPLL